MSVFENWLSATESNVFLGWRHERIIVAFYGLDSTAGELMVVVVDSRLDLTSTTRRTQRIELVAAEPKRNVTNSPFQFFWVCQQFGNFGWGVIKRFSNMAEGSNIHTIIYSVILIELWLHIVLCFSNSIEASFMNHKNVSP